MIEIKLKTNKIKTRKCMHYGRPCIGVEPVSSEYYILNSIQVYISDTPGICVNDNPKIGGYNQLDVFDDYILLDGDLPCSSLFISIDPNMYYIEIDAKESDNKEWLYITVTIKRKDN